MAGRVQMIASGYFAHLSGRPTIQTIVTDNPSSIDRCIYDINNVSMNLKGDILIGLRFQPGILRLSFGQDCLIFTLPFHHPLPPLLRQFLQNDKKVYTFVGVDVSSLEETLFNSYGVRLHNVIDLGHLSSIKFDKNFLCGASLKILAKNVLDKDINETMNISIINPSEPVKLKGDEVLHLCKDSYVLHDICKRLDLVSSLEEVGTNIVHYANLGVNL